MKSQNAHLPSASKGGFKLKVTKILKNKFNLHLSFLKNKR